MLETYAFIDSGRKYYIRMGGLTIHRKPSLQIILDPPRMEKCFTADADLYPVVDAFLKAADQYGGDPIAVNLLKEFRIMAKNKVVVVDVKESKVFAVTASVEKATEAITAGGEGKTLKTCANAEEFATLPEAVRLAIAKTNPDVASMPKEEQLSRAYEIACKPVKAPKAPPKAKAKGVKTLIRELFQVPGARHSVDDICRLTNGTPVSVKTAISDLRSVTYCKPGEPMNLTHLPDGKYALLSAAEVNKIKADAAAAKAKEEADKKAKKEAEKKEAADKKAAAEKAAAEKKAAEKK